MLQLCSYLVWWILLMSWFYKQNMSTIRAFLTTPKFWIENVKFWTLSKMLWFGSYLMCENNSSKGFITPNMSIIGAIFKFLDLGPKFWDFVKNAPILLIFGVIKPFDELFSHTKYEHNRSIFDNVQNFGPNYFDDTEKRYPRFLISCYK